MILDISLKKWTARSISFDPYDFTCNSDWPFNEKCTWKYWSVNEYYWANPKSKSDITVQCGGDYR